MEIQSKVKKLVMLSSFLFCYEVMSATKAPQPSIDDKIITKNILIKISQEKPLSKAKIRVKTVQGNVTISGFVEHDYQEDLAFKLAESTEGVREVFGSREPTRDLLITAKIEGILIRNKLMDYPIKKDKDLKLVTDKGVVNFYGKVLDRNQENRIVSIAKSVQGVVQVISHLELMIPEFQYCPIKKVKKG